MGKDAPAEKEIFRPWRDARISRPAFEGRRKLLAGQAGTEYASRVMGGVFYVWFIPVAAVLGVALVVFYLAIRRTWPKQDEKKGGVQLALEQAPPESGEAQQSDSPDRPT